MLLPTRSQTPQESFLVCVGVSKDHLAEIARLVEGKAAVLGVPDIESARALVCGEAVYVQAADGGASGTSAGLGGCGQAAESAGRDDRWTGGLPDEGDVRVYGYTGRRLVRGESGASGPETPSAPYAVLPQHPADGDQPDDQVATVDGQASYRTDDRYERDGSRTYDGLRVDASRRLVTWQGRPIELSAREFDLLVALAKHAGHVWTFAELTEVVWQRPYIGDTEAVVSAVKRLRRRIARVTTDIRVDSVRGVGFRLVAAA